MAESRAAHPTNDLLRRALAGDGSAENALFERLHARVLRVAKKRIWNEETSEDLVQETMRTALEKYRTADLSHGLFPWVFKILHHKVGNYLKRRRVEVQRAAGDMPSLVGQGSWRSGTGEIGAIDLAESLEKALRTATEECRKVFRLLLADAPREEMRVAFENEPIGTTYSRISRCREKLLRALEELWREGKG